MKKKKKNKRVYPPIFIFSLYYISRAQVKRNI